MDEEFPPDALEFWDLTIDRRSYPAGRGVLYEKPSPSTVRARLFFPRLEPAPVLWPGQRIRLTAFCANRRWMRDIPGEVHHWAENRDGSRTAEILLHRKTARPA